MAEGDVGDVSEAAVELKPTSRWGGERGLKGDLLLCKGGSLGLKGGL
jgi:hypothetical protein